MHPTTCDYVKSPCDSKGFFDYNEEEEEEE